MAKAKILKIPARGEWAFAEVETDKDGVLPVEALEDAVGGWFEYWRLGEVGFPRLDMFLNEEGKLKGLSLNVVATSLSGILVRGDCIVGDVIVCRHGDANSIGLTDADELALGRRLSELGF
jgi:hypothetical protein